MKHPVSLLPAAFALALLALPAQAQEAPRTITVSADGAVRSKPDMATVTIGVVHRAETPQAALALLDAGISPVIERLIAAGIPQSDIQTTTLELVSVYDWVDNQEVFRGYEARTALVVMILDLDQLGTLLGAAVADGANRIGEVRFGLRDEQTALDAARVAAVAAAQGRARLYADAAGVDLGDLLTLNERAGMTMDLGGRIAADTTVVVPVEPPGGSVGTSAGELVSSVSVTLVYEID